MSYSEGLCLFILSDINYRATSSNQYRGQDMHSLAHLFHELTTCDSLMNLHFTINIQKLMIEFYKYLYGLSAPIMKEVFTKRILKYNLRNCRENLLPNPKTKKYGTDTVAYKASQLWSTL